MKTAEHARCRLEAAGYLVRTDAREPGVLRSYGPARPQHRSFYAGPEPVVKYPLVGLIVIRDGQITYAEHAGYIFPFYPTDSRTAREQRVLRLFRTIEATSA